MSSAKTAWQQTEVAQRFVDERRAAIPYGPDQIRMMLHLIERFCPQPRQFLDLGCGDGILARTLLELYPQTEALLLDHSAPMLERARIAMAGFAERCEIRSADLADPISAQVASVDVVVSGYAIHHLPHARKRSLYGEIYTVLAPGGLFVNIEHIASPSAEVEALFDALYIDHMAALLHRPREQVAAEHHNRPDKADNILSPLESQLEWLREIGFEHVDCFFKWLELAVFGGAKPDSRISSG